MMQGKESVRERRNAALLSSEAVMNSLHNVSPMLTADGSFKESAYLIARHAIYSGILLKQSKQIAMIWRKRFFMLMPDGILYYFQSPTETRPIKSIDVRETTLVAATSKYKRHGLLIETTSRVYFFACDNEQEVKEWLHAIQQAKIDLAVSSNRNSASLTATTTTAAFPPTPVHQRASSVSQQKLSRAFSIVGNAPEMQPWYDWSIEMMRHGFVVVKLPFLAQHSGKPKKRFLQLSQDQKELRWGIAKVRDNNSILNRALPIANIERIIYGPYSSTWAKYYEKIKTGKWRTISIVCTVPSKKAKVKRRTIDLQFKTENETLAALIGLLYLSGKSKSKDAEVNKVLALYKWTKFKLQVEEKAEAQNKSFGEVVAEAIHKALDLE
jgi:hypothetical protein